MVRDNLITEHEIVPSETGGKKSTTNRGRQIARMDADTVPHIYSQRASSVKPSNTRVQSDQEKKSRHGKGEGMYSDGEKGKRKRREPFFNRETKDKACSGGGPKVNLPSRKEPGLNSWEVLTELKSLGHIISGGVGGEKQAKKKPGGKAKKSTLYSGKKTKRDTGKMNTLGRKRSSLVEPIELNASQKNMSGLIETQTGPLGTDRERQVKGCSTTEKRKTPTKPPPF